jgi:hypothetical protein
MRLGVVVHTFSTLRRLRLEDHKFRVSLGYIARLCLKNK